MTLDVKGYAGYITIFVIVVLAVILAPAIKSKLDGLKKQVGA